jgi:hypothetical protein
LINECASLHPVVDEITKLQQILWTAAIVCELSLAVILLLYRNYRTYPAFTYYIFLVLANDLFLIFAYRRWGFTSLIAWRIFWISRAIVICARALAIEELCRLLLAQYKGVWALAWRLLLVCAVIVLVCSLIIGKHEWSLAVHTASRGLDLAIAAFIVGLFLFVKYYDVKTDRTARILTTGFFLYSCFGVLNTTFLERWLYDYSALWNILNSLTFLASLLLWTSALRSPLTASVREKILLPGTVYSTVGPEVNLRLHLLNKSLSQFWNPGAPQP